ncbi:MAG: 3-oxoacyl-[acyl-carrier-protein] synthase 2 [Phycisphaerae bacterium]|nr:3-oxoacyl-[acyl-carrier-protein] synthase 2 [Phycisphaerae bacterium]
MNERRVVITGMGVITSLGSNLETFWERLLRGESGIDHIRQFDASQFDVRFAGECVDFSPDPYIDRREAKRLDRFAQMAVAAAKEAWKDSNLDMARVDATRVGVIMGSGIGGLLEIEEQYKRLMEKGPSKVSAFTIPKLMGNAASANVSIFQGAKGPSTSVVTACASAAHALGDALWAIKRGEADIMYAGGAEAAVTPLGLAAFSAMKALSTRNDDPRHASRPFDRDRDGFVMGEGAGVLILEEMEHALNRGARIYAELAGVGASSDAGHITQPDEQGDGAVRAMQAALQHARIQPTQVSYINAHGTSTPLGDVAETNAIKRVFGDHARRLAISSTKSALGHLLGASGAVELVVTVMTLQRNIITPTINLEHPDPQCDLDYVPNQPRDMRVDVALCNSFGFGGHNASVCVRRLS